MGRPRKPSAVRDLEGNRSKTPIPKEPELQGIPSVEHASRTADEFFRFMKAECYWLKRADSPALKRLSDLQEKFWLASDIADVNAMTKLAAAIDRASSRLGLSPVDRSRLLEAPKEKPDETEERFFKVTG
jgi:hypothetical protein